MSGNDILQQISDEDLPKLIEIYKKSLPLNSLVHNYLCTVLRWKSKHPETKRFTILAPYGNWKDGTFIGINEYNSYELIASALDKDCKELCEALIKTKRIQWNRALEFYGLSYDLYPAVSEALKQTDFQPGGATIYELWWLPKEKAINLQADCPPEVYTDKLQTIHAERINSAWPLSYTNSQKYIAAMIEMNGGYGVFLKSNDELIAWVLQNTFGLGALQTLDEHKRKGYGSLITKVLAKSFAEQGYDPIGTVMILNEASKSMFGKIGFSKLYSVIFVKNLEMKMAENEEQ